MFHTCKCWHWRGQSPPSRAPRPCGASSDGSVPWLLRERGKFETPATFPSPGAKLTVAGDVYAADQSELARRLVGVDVVAVGLDVAAVVAVLALHRHQVQQLQVRWREELIQSRSNLEYPH